MDMQLNAVTLWESFEPASPYHPYINAKGGRPEGLRMVPSDSDLRIAGASVAGWLAVPVWSGNHCLQTLQLIPPPGVGRKLNLPGHAFGDGCFLIGDAQESGRVFVVEGLGQAWSCATATGDAAAVSFGAGRMGTVAKALRERMPDARLVLVPDRGKEDAAEAIASGIPVHVAKLPADKPTNYDANDYLAEHGADALAELLERAQSAGNRYRLKAAADLLNAPPLRWMVRGVLPSEGLACLYGTSGSGKSFLALDLCAAIASGSRWFSRKVNAAPVVYLALEGEAGFSQRVKAWQQHHRTALPDSLRFIMQPFDLLNPEDLQAMAAAFVAAGGSGGLLVIDTLNRAASGAEENASRDMSGIIDAAKALQTQINGAVLLIHHSGKDQSRGLRGHSSLGAAIDTSIEVMKLENRREWRIAKCKDGSDEAAHGFRLEILEIGRHEDGEPITSCAVVPEDGRQELRRAIPPKSGNQKIAFDGVCDLLKRDGAMSPPDAPPSLPAGCPAVPLEAVLATIRGRLTCDPKRRTERAQNALTGLHARGLIGIEGGWLWKT